LPSRTVVSIKRTLSLISTSGETVQVVQAVPIVQNVNSEQTTGKVG
jgi:D-arabinose 5-phosphate isomerase GutQ